MAQSGVGYTGGHKFRILCGVESTELVVPEFLKARSTRRRLQALLRIRRPSASTGTVLMNWERLRCNASGNVHGG